MRFTAPGLFDSQPASGNQITVRALLFYEGAHTDSIGKKAKYSAQQIEAMATATNELQSTRRAKFFKDHEYSQNGTLGWIDGPVTAEIITQTPHPGMDDLTGKLGIYANITIAGEANVEAYKDGLIKEISVGIDIKGASFGFPMAIYELSAVGIPALAGAALFGMTIGQTIAQEQGQQELWRLWEIFQGTIRTIGDADETQLQGRSAASWQAQAVEDFASKLREAYPAVNSPPIDNPDPLPIIPIFSAPEPNQMTDQEILDLQAKAAKVDALETQLASLTRSSEVSARFSALKDKAIALRSAGKLTPAKFKEMGFDEAETTIAKFAAGDDRELDKLEIKLETIEEIATPVKFGGYLGNESLPESNSQETASNMDRLRNRRPIA
jgi:hypothetical protein